MKKAALILLAALVLSLTGLSAHNSQDYLLAKSDRPAWTVDFAKDKLPDGVQVSTQYAWDSLDHLVLYAKDSSLTLKFELEPGDYSGCRLVLTSRGSYLLISLTDPNDLQVYSPYTILVNGNIVAEDVEVQNLRDQDTSYQVGEYLNQGENEITISLSPLSTTHFEIRQIQLYKN